MWGISGRAYTKNFGVFWDITHAETGEMLCMHHSHFRRRNCTSLFGDFWGSRLRHAHAVTGIHYGRDATFFIGADRANSMPDKKPDKNERQGWSANISLFKRGLAAGTGSI